MPAEPRPVDLPIDAPGDSPVDPPAATRPATVVPPKILSALARYRVAALVVGFALIVLCIAMVLRYGFGQHWAVAVWGPIHGMLYVGYVLLAFDLAYKDRWSLTGTLGVLLAGVIPGVSFVAERIVHRKVLARQKV